jgi:hypothetical protein
VADIAAGEGTEPEALGHLHRREIAPAMGDIALVAAFIINDRLLVLLAISDGAVHVGRLQAGMRHPGLGVIVNDTAVVNTAQALVRVFLLQDREKPVPVIHLFVAAVSPWPVGHKIELVGERPPDVAERRQPGDRITQVCIVLSVGHIGEAPAVVRMPEDEIRLDPELLQVENSAFEMVPEGRVRLIEIKTAVRFVGKSEQLRLVLVIGVALGEDTEANLVERRSGQRLQGLLLQPFRLMDPGVAGGAELVIRRTVQVAQVEGVENFDRSVIASCRSDCCEAARLLIERWIIAPGGELPGADGRRTEPNAEGMPSVPEPRHVNGPVALGEDRGKGGVEPWVLRRRGGFEHGFEHAPLFHSAKTPRSGDQECGENQEMDVFHNSMRL